MDNVKKISRRDFIKYLLTTMFTFICVFKTDILSFANSKDVFLDSNNVKY